MTTELVTSILTTDPVHCFANRNVMLMVRNHTIDMREKDETRVLKYVVHDPHIRSELEALHACISDALAAFRKLGAESCGGNVLEASA
ncbi:hypothetical protein U879_17605 [Defluviimonas sp. 20V17]|uniref:Uncharacterized protein n=1 Tax=Allgaiera indica TaxID=765699 RepID=A0AAN5A0G1_9RHOB|nr:hypothetical protein [Allgaiera indica]KDB02401.1 hypothetical protein U879_17605 [Defluviimonas sp. 20V17]GHE02198.1 hypothetical protein GCM10008024_20850 [Allgaiera indica]SDX06502.1 hypothetical protein SAMN05444006_109139 [Allgaiera indica]